jgi:hypothetical protein
MSRKRVTGKSNKIFQDKTDLPYYDEMIENPEYFRRAKRMAFKIKKMRPDDYFKECSKIHGVPLDKEFQSIDDKYVREYTERTKQGSPMPMPFLHYGEHGGQEGRHRVAVAKKLGKNTIPVMTVNRMKEEDWYNWLLSNKPDSMEAQYSVPKEFKDNFYKKSKRK